MATFILIHGAAHGGWCWDAVRQILEGAGHCVVAPDLPGHRSVESGQRPNIQMADYVSAVAGLIDRQAAKVILVGHSMGGFVTTLAACEMPQKVENLIHVAAFVPAPGDTVQALFSSDPASSLSEAFSVTADGTHALLLPGKLASVVYQGCTDEQVALAAAKAVPQPLAPFTSQASFDAEILKTISQRAVVCTKDKVISPAFQKSMYEKSGAVLSFLDSGHAPFYSCPKELVDQLGEY